MNYLIKQYLCLLLLILFGLHFINSRDNNILKYLFDYLNCFESHCLLYGTLSKSEVA